MRSRPLLELSFVSDLACAEVAVGACATLAQQLGFSDEECSDIGMALRESVNNAIIHGNSRNGHKKVRVRFLGAKGQITVVVRDQGPGFDPTTVPDPTAPENLLRPCGRGIFLMRHFMDDVAFRFRGPGTEVKLVRHARSR